MGDGSEGEARRDFRIFCTALLLEEESPPLIDNIDSNGMSELLAREFICSGVEDSSRPLPPLMPMPSLHPIMALHDALLCLARWRKATPEESSFDW